MVRYLRTLKTLRQIALDHATSPQPDLAAMARELGRIVHRDSVVLAAQLTPLRSRRHGFGRWLLAARSQPPISVLLTALPPNHVTALRDPTGVWSLQMPLLGALELQSCTRDPHTGQLHLRRRDWLGPGDGHWVDRDAPDAQRCRNLSKHDTALMLHVCGGDPPPYLAQQRAAVSGRWLEQRRQPALAALPRG